MVADYMITIVEDESKREMGTLEVLFPRDYWRCYAVNQEWKVNWSLFYYFSKFNMRKYSAPR